MAPNRTQGPTGIEYKDEACWIDKGTTCRQQSSTPQAVGKCPSVFMSLSRPYQVNSSIQPVVGIYPEAFISPTRVKVAQDKGDQSVEVLVVSYDWLKEHAIHLFEELQEHKDHILTAKDSYSLVKVLRDVGLEGRFAIQIYKGAEFIILSGRTFRQRMAALVLKGVRFGADNPKIVDMAIGSSGLTKFIKDTFYLAIIFNVGFDVIIGVLKKSTLEEIGLTIVADEAKTVIATVFSAIAIFLIAEVTAIIWLPISGGIVVGYAVSDKMDEHFPTQGLVSDMQSVIRTMKDLPTTAKRAFSKRTFYRFLYENKL